MSLVNVLKSVKLTSAMLKLSMNFNRAFCQQNTFLYSYLPLLPVLDVLEGRAGVCALDRPTDGDEIRPNLNP